MRRGQSLNRRVSVWFACVMLEVHLDVGAGAKGSGFEEAQRGGRDAKGEVVPEIEGLGQGGRTVA